MRDAAIDDPADVHFVQIKCPLLTAQRIAAADARGATVATRDTLKSMGLSRAASALGIGLAPGEIAPEQVTDAAIGSAWSLKSGEHTSELQSLMRISYAGICLKQNTRNKTRS